MTPGTTTAPGTISPLKLALIREFGFRCGEDVILRVGSGAEAPTVRKTITGEDAQRGVVSIGDAHYDALSGLLAPCDHRHGRIYSSIRRPKPPGVAALKGGVA